MKLWRALLAAIALLSFAHCAAAQGTLRWLKDCAPPDFAGFPEGTTRIRVSHFFQAGEDPAARDRVEVSWEFETVEGLPDVAPRDARSEAVDMPPSGTAFPQLCVDPGPMKTAEEFVRALFAKDSEKLRSLLAPAAASRHDEDPDSAMARYEAGISESGLAREQLVSCLPTLAYIRPRTAALELRYSFAASPDGKMVEISIGLGVLAGEKPRWAIHHFGLSASAAAPPATSGGKIAGKGLVALAEGFRMADLGNFPDETDRVNVETWFEKSGRIFQVKARFRPLAGSSIVLLEDLKIRPAERNPAGAAMPDALPAEGPMDSARAYLEAVRSFDIRGAAAYLPSASRKDYVDSAAARGMEAFKAGSARVAEKLGFDPGRVISGNLPVLLGLPGNCGRLEVEYEFGGMAKGRPGRFVVSLALAVEESTPDHWVVERAECDFEPED